MNSASPALPETQPGLRIRHPHINEAINDCRLMLAAGCNANLILLCGPTGVGKSTLGDFLVEAELKQQQGILEAHPGVIPALRIEAPASGEQHFSWRLFYQRALHGLESRLDVPRTAYGIDQQTGRMVRERGPRMNSLSSMRTALERALKERQTRFIVVDEAAHIMRQCHPSRLEQQLDTLKSLSNEYQIQWILLGSYELFELVSLSGQLARRTHVIHFERYREDREEDVVAFMGTLKMLAAKQPALKGLDVLRYAEVLHQNTLGCVGTLSSVLARLNLLVAEKGFSEETLRRALLTEAQVTQIMREIVEGETRIAPGLNRQLVLPSAA